MKLEPARVAEVFVQVAGQRDVRFASGYLVRDGHVLTAAHVLHGVIESVRLRFNADQDDEWTPAAKVAWRDDQLDIAVLRITGPLAGPPATLSAVSGVRFGVIQDPPAECHAIGFPWFKVRDDPMPPPGGGRPAAYAEYEHVIGLADPYGGIRSRTITFSVSTPAPPAAPGRLPWQGMSGAAVFSQADGLLVGVISANFPAEGPGRLMASNVDRWYGVLSAADVALLGELIGLPPDRAGLTPVASRRPAPGHGDAIPPPVLAAATRSYLAWVEKVNSGLKVTGLKASDRAMTIDLDRVYVGLKVDFSSQEEREAARANRLQALRADPAAEPSLDDDPDDSFQLAPESTDADPWGALAAQTISAPADEEFSIGELYRRGNASVILGDPGSGKTTIARWLALQHARAMILDDPVVRVGADAVGVAARDAGQFDLGPPLLPILVRVAEYAAYRRLRQPGEAPRTLLKFLGQHFGGENQPTWPADLGPRYRENTEIPAEILADICYAALREGRALVILDGLDEVPRGERGDVADAIGDFIGSWTWHRPPAGAPPGHIAVKVIATSRIAGYNDAPLPADLTQVTIQPMPGPAVDAFIRNRITEVLAGLAGQQHQMPDPLAAEAAARRLLSLLSSDENAYARAMAANPLLAGAIVNVFIDQDQQDLPRQRVELLDSAISVLAAVWRERLSGTYRQETEDDILAALPAVAAYIHDTEPTGVIAAPEFERELLGELRLIRGLADDRPDPALQRAVRSLIEIMNEELGVLVASGPERYRFAHRSFQEYLAAQHLIADPELSASRVLDRLGDPQWREPVLLAIGLMNWRHPDKMANFVSSLLAQDGPLARFFPETALLLAAAITQLTGVPPDVARQTARHLLASFTAAFRERRLPRVRDLLAAALATLRAKHTREIDGVLIAALRRPPDADPIAACAAAQVIRDIGAATPRLAEALADAAVAWDSAEFGSPIAAALGLLVSPAALPDTGKPRPRLPAAAWTGGRLALRDKLIAEPDLVVRIRRNPRLVTLILAIYGGCWNLDTPAALDSYERFSDFLRLDELARQEFGAYVAPRYRTARFGNEDPVLAMMFAYRSERKAASRRFAAVPVFDAAAITRDSPLTWDIIDAIEGEDPALAGLARRLRGSLAVATADIEWRADALVALWALGDPAGPDVMAARPADPAVLLAARRISGLLPGLADAAIRAAPLAGQALAEAARRLPAADWELLGAALTKILLHAGATPVNLFAQRDRIPPSLLPRVLTEELAQRVGGCGDDPRRDAERFIAEAEREDFPLDLVSAALCAQGSAWSNSYRRFANWWPCDPLAFPPDADDDIPLAVFDQLATLPSGAGLIFGWFTDRLGAALAQGDPAGLFENGVITAARVSVSDPGRAQKLVDLHLAVLSRIDEIFGEAWGQAPQRGEMFRREARQLSDPWRSARGLLRIAELLPEERPAALADATLAADQVGDPARAFQLHERIALLGPIAERPGQLTRCRALALSIADHANSARALLRLTRLSGQAEIEDLVSAAADRISRIDSRAEQLELLRVCREMFPDRPGCLAQADRVLRGIGASGQQQAHVAGRWGDAVTRHLPALCGADEALIQALAPVALYAQAIDLARADRQDQLAGAWRELRATVSPEAVRQLLDAQAEPFIQCTGPVARALDESLAHGDPHSLEPVLNRLVRVGHDAEPTMRAWLEHRLPQAQRTAALLLAERHAITTDTAALVGGLLSADDDLLRSRAIARVAPGPFCVQMSVTTMGPRAVTLLARDQPGSAAGLVTVTGWHRNRLLHDDPQALSAWCDAAEQDSSDPAASRIVSGISWLTTPAWLLLLDRLRDGSPTLQASILHAISGMLYQGTDGDGDFQQPQGALRIDTERWEQLHAVLAAIDPEPLRAMELLPISSISQVLDTVDVVLPSTGPVPDGTSGRRASRALRDASVTSFGTILAAADQAAIRQGLYRIGEAKAASIYTALHDVQLVRQRRLGPDRADGPWTGLLTAWVSQLLRRPSIGEVDATELDAVLEALAAAAQVEPESFRQHAHAAELSQRLADKGLHHGGYLGRAAAATLLGALRYGSPDVFQALRSMLHDSAVEVRQAAMEAILRLRRFDRRLIRDLTNALSGTSVTVAWASAQLLGAIGANTRTPKDARDAIIAALAAAAGDPRSRRQVHFAYAETTMPEMPELDDVFTVALRRVYRLG